MKLVRAILHPEKVFPVKDVLTKNGYHGIMTKEGYGYGEKVKTIKQVVRGRVFEQRVDGVKRVELELVVPDNHVRELIETIRDVVNTDQGGEGRIYVSDIESSIHIHTGDIHLGDADEKSLRDI